MLEFLHCECTVFSENALMNEVLEIYRNAGETGKNEGFVPLFIIPSIDMLEHSRKRRGKEAVLRKELNELLSEHQRNDKLGQELILAKIPGKQPWEVVTGLPHSWWTSRTEEIDFALRARKWYELYGAVPAVFTSQKVEFVQDKRAAEKSRYFRYF